MRRSLALSVMLVVGLSVFVAWKARQRERPDVFVYVIDALRPDHLGCYGYPRGTSPELDAFAAEATLFEQAYSTSNWTRPAVVSLLTGLYPSAHGTLRSPDAMAAWPVALPELLQEAGYATCAVILNPHTSKDWGFESGFQRFKESQGSESFLCVERDWATKWVRRFLDQRDPRERVFVYVHTVEPHIPYAPKSESFTRFDRGLIGACDGSIPSIKQVGVYHPKLSDDGFGHLIDLYDAQVWEADRNFGDFLDMLRREGRYENAVIVVLADHGEAFGEHETLGHGNTLCEEEIRIPLVVRFPGGHSAARRVKQAASIIDLFPTILAAVGLEVELAYPLAGLDLADCPRDSGTENSRAIYAEQWGWNETLPGLVGMIDGEGYKRVVEFSSDKSRAAEWAGLWDTKGDPGEQINLCEQQPERAAWMGLHLSEWVQEQRAYRAGATPTIEMTEDMRQALHALGYLR